MYTSEPRFSASSLTPRSAPPPVTVAERSSQPSTNGLPSPARTTCEAPRTGRGATRRAEEVHARSPVVTRVATRAAAWVVAKANISKDARAGMTRHPREHPSLLRALSTPRDMTQRQLATQQQECDEDSPTLRTWILNQETTSQKCQSRFAFCFVWLISHDKMNALFRQFSVASIRTDRRSPREARRRAHTRRAHGASARTGFDCPRERIEALRSS